jgi:glycosyltransferase involved in cell wall biosynthesis
MLFRKNKKNRQFKRIVHLIHDDGPGGGPNTVIRHMKYYSKYYNIILLHGGKGRIQEYCQSEGLESKQLPVNRLWKTLWGWIPLFFNLKKLNPDLLIVHGQWGGVLGALVGKLASIDNIIYIAQWPSFYTDWDLYRVIRNHFIEAICVRLCNKAVCISPGNLYQYQIRFPKYLDRLIHIPNPFDLDNPPTKQQAAQLRQSEGWCDDHVNIVCVGRLSTQKHFEWLLKSWEIVQAEVPAARLWIIGSGEEEQMLKALAKLLGITTTCKFMGPKKDGMAYINASDFVVMTSLYEGHANIPMEAHFCGKAIVASAVDGVRETINDTKDGFLVSAGDIKTFANRIVKLCHSKDLRERMGMEGRENVTRFSMGKVMLEYSALINQNI